MKHEPRKENHESTKVTKSTKETEDAEILVPTQSAGTRKLFVPFLTFVLSRFVFRAFVVLFSCSVLQFNIN